MLFENKILMVQHKSEPSSGGGYSPPTPPTPPPSPNIKKYLITTSVLSVPNDLAIYGKLEYTNLNNIINFGEETFVKEDTNLEFKISTNREFLIKSVTVNNIDVGISGFYSVPDVATDINIEVEFMPRPLDAYDEQLLPTDFLFLKYADNSIISLQTNIYNSSPRDMFSNDPKLRTYNLSINSSIESRSIDILLNNTNLFKLANPNLPGGSYYENINAVVLGATQFIPNAETLNLKPFLSASNFLIKSRNLIQESDSEVLSPYTVEVQEDFLNFNKNKPFIQSIPFEFQNNKHYYVEFTNNVYYYNDGGNYTEINGWKKDTYRSIIRISFKENGITNFKDPLPTPIQINLSSPKDKEEKKINIPQPPKDKEEKEINIRQPIQVVAAPNLRVQNKYFRRQICGNCVFNQNGFCTKYQFKFKPGQVCDAWERNGISEEYKYSNGDYLLNNDLYYGNYHLWTNTSQGIYVAYTGNYFGELSERQPLIFNNIIKVLHPNISSNQQAKSTTSVSSFKSLDTIISSSLKNEIIGRREDSNQISLNIDYGNFKNFILFSSAYDRVLNFRTKLDTVENYSLKISDIESLGSITHVELSQSLVDLKLKKDKVINNLSGFEKYLYFESGSIYSGSFVLPHPKTSTSIPYTLNAVSSSTSVTYFNNLLQSASIYDENNFNSLYNKLPQYFREEGNIQFAGYGRLIKMYAEYFDFLYMYAKETANRKFEDIKNKTNVSKELVPYLLDYYNLFDSSKQLESSLNDFYLNNATYTSGNFQDYKDELYYRLLMNGAYIAKARGTKKSIKAILNCIGIPENYLQIKEYGRNQDNYDDDIDEVKIKKDTIKRYYLDFKGEQNIKVNWKKYGTDNSVPNAIQLKFKSDSNTGLYTSQVLLEGTSSVSGSWAISLISTGSTYEAASGIVKFVLSGSVSCSTSELPIFNNHLWTVYFYRDTSTYTSPTQSYQLNAQQFRFDAVNFSSTGTLIVTESRLNNKYGATGSLYVGGTSTSAISPSIYGSPYYGEAAELRLWKTAILDESNDAFVKASSFHGGNTSVTSSFTDLVTWLRLDEDINHYSTSSVNDYNLTGTKNHGTASNFENATDDSNYLDYYEEEQYELQNFDVNTPSDEKIYIVSSTPITVLSSMQRVEKSSKKLYGVESNRLSIDMSTNSLVNDDIFKSFDFEIDNFIGDPRELQSGSYAGLESFKKDYLTKYPSSTVNPYLVFNQAKGYDSLLFDAVKKNVPFKSDLQIGFRVEQTAAERFKTNKKLSMSSTFNKYTDTIDVKGSIQSLAEYTTKNAIITDAKDINCSNSVENLSKTDTINVFVRDAKEKIRYKEDKYDTPLSRVPGFSNYKQSCILPASEFSKVYTKSGDTFVQSLDTALEPTWGTVNGLLNVVYTSDHIRKTRNDRFLRIIKKGTTQVQTSDLDGKSIIEIRKTTSRTAKVFDDNSGDIRLRAE